MDWRGATVQRYLAAPETRFGSTGRWTPGSPAGGPPVPSVEAAGRTPLRNSMEGMRLRPVHLARWSARHPWRAIAGWFLFVLLCLGAGIASGSNAATTKDFRVGEAGHAESPATGTIRVVAAVLSSLTVLPALLVKLGHRAERRAARKAAIHAARRSWPRASPSAWSRRCGARPRSP